MPRKIFRLLKKSILGYLCGMFVLIFWYRSRKYPTVQHTKKLEKCPLEWLSEQKRRSRHGGIKLNVQLSEESLSNLYKEWTPGGSWRPEACEPRQKVAILIPYRDRKIHLQTLLYNLIPHLERFMNEYRLVVIEQIGTELFNKGRLFNAGIIFAEKFHYVDCMIFHDVDLIPERKSNWYDCYSDAAVHLAPYVNTLNYTLKYRYLMGGVVAVPSKVMRRVNGFSNLYWGWGGEDDDLGLRLIGAKIRIVRPDITQGRYKMLDHPGRNYSNEGAVRQLLNCTVLRMQEDGLNLENVAWTLVKTETRQLYTHLMVDVGKPPNIWTYPNASQNTGKLVTTNCGMLGYL